MRLAHEALPVSDDAPSPEQLFLLASRGVLLAKQTDKFRPMPGSIAERSHSMMPASRVIVPELMTAPLGHRFEQRMSARIARPAPRRWSMRLLSSFIVTDMGSLSGAERHTYSFEWNDRETTLAHHRLDIVPADERDMYDEIDRFSADDTVGDEFYWRTQLAQVTRGDVELLTAEFDSLINAGQR